MCAWLVRRGEALGLASAAEGGAIQVAALGIVGRGNVVEPVTLFIDRLDAHDIEFSWRDEPDPLPRSGNGVDMAPAIALADPDEVLAPVQPAQVVYRVKPGLVGLGEHRPHRA